MGRVETRGMSCRRVLAHSCFFLFYYFIIIFCLFSFILCILFSNFDLDSKIKSGLQFNWHAQSRKHIINKIFIFMLIIYLLYYSFMQMLLIMQSILTRICVLRK